MYLQEKMYFNSSSFSVFFLNITPTKYRLTYKRTVRELLQEELAVQTQR